MPTNGINAPPAPQGPLRMVRMNCEASRLLTRSAIEADRVVRRGVNRLGRGRLDPGVYQAGTRRLKDKIHELDRTIQEVLGMFVPAEASKTVTHPQLPLHSED